MKPFSQACENNQAPILSQLKDFFADRKKVLEIGSGTGQHAVYFGGAMSALQWQCGDLIGNHPGIRAWLDEAQLPNVLVPIEIDADQPGWNVGQYDAVFSANTLHIMSWQQVERLFQHLGEVLLPSAKLAVYGPFNYQGRFTCDSNARFDQWLKQTAAHQGIRDFETVERLAQQIGLRLLADKEMPANNRLLLWQK